MSSLEFVRYFLLDNGFWPFYLNGKLQLAFPTHVSFNDLSGSKIRIQLIHIFYDLDLCDESTLDDILSIINNGHPKISIAQT